MVSNQKHAPRKTRFTSFGVLRPSSLLGLALTLGATNASVAGAQSPSKSLQRLTVRPHEMTIGSQKEPGQHLLNENGDSIYIPSTVAGKGRVPLILSFSGDPITRWRPMADHYGMIFVTVRETMQGVRDGSHVIKIDTLLRQVLRKYAVDPDKIAMLGMSNGGMATVDLACRNLDIFSRIGLISPVPGRIDECDDLTRPVSERTPFFLTMGVGEPNLVLGQVLAMAPKMRAQGHPLQLALNLRYHVSRQKDYGALWQWLAEGWGSSKASARTTTHARTIPVSSLNVAALTKMTSFWEKYHQEYPPKQDDSDDWPTVNEKPVTITVGAEQMAVYDMTDLRSIAAQRPPVAAALKKAGLTFAQEESYRAAFISARATMLAKNFDSTLAVNPALKQNIEFFRQHLDAANKLLDFMNVPRCELGPQESYEKGSCFSSTISGVA